MYLENKNNDHIDQDDFIHDKETRYIWLIE